MSWTIERYEPSHATEVALLWNEEFGERYPLKAELLAQRWQPDREEPHAAWIARDRSRVVGALLIRVPKHPWFPAATAFVTLLVVTRGMRRHGIGRALLTTATETLRQQGIRMLVFGGGPGHLVPGIPSEAPLATWRFVRAAGGIPHEVFHDLLVDLSLPLPAASLSAETHLELAPPEQMLPFLHREFPGEWEIDVTEAYRADATVLGLSHHGELVGFAAAHHPGAWPAPPSLFWASTLPGAVAGLGPLGIAAAYRKRGLGLAMVIGALEYLRNTGARWVVIDWTELASFYGRAGAHLWRTYQRAALPLT